MADSYKPPRKQKQKEVKPVLSGAGERLKTIVRRLPPNLPEDIFWQSVQPWVSDETVSWKAYYPGKFRTKRMNKEGVPSRAYIAFKNEEQVATFSREYDGHLFRDKAGNESHAIVEFSPFQKTPIDKRKPDARNNTIEKDDDYRSFLEALDAAKSESVPFETLLAASQPPPPPTTTPLLEALKAEKSAQKDKEAILRNHAHYKDVAKKEEAKKKPLPVVVPKGDLPAPSKRGKKDKERERAKGGGGTRAPQPPPPPTTTHEGAVPTTPNRHRSSKHAKGDPPAASLPAKPGPASPVPAPAPAHAPLVPPSTPNPAAVATTDTPLTQPQRKHRPVLGLGRHFETALNGAVAKKRNEESAVPMSILQREVVIMQRPASPKEQVGEGPSASPVIPPAHGAGPGRGPRRGRGRGRGHRGG